MRRNTCTEPPQLDYSSAILVRCCLLPLSGGMHRYAANPWWNLSDAVPSGAVPCRSCQGAAAPFTVMPPPAAGKSTIAQQLAARLNMPNVMQTDVICEVGNTASRIPERSARPPGYRRNQAYTASCATGPFSALLLHTRTAGA